MRKSSLRNWLKAAATALSVGIIAIFASYYFRLRPIHHYEILFFRHLYLPQVPLVLHREQHLPWPGVEIWLHRSNSVERLRFAIMNFAGAEIDVVVSQDGKSLDVTHPPAASIDLSLDELLSSVNPPRNFQYWLDLKGLDEKNLCSTINTLKGFRNRWAIEDRMLVESPYLEGLTLLTQAGFRTAYYFPQDFDYYRLSNRELAKRIHDLQLSLSTASVCAISADAYYYPLLKTYFPKYDLLLWTSIGRLGSWLVTLDPLLADPKVRLVLIHRHSSGYR